MAIHETKFMIRLFVFSLPTDGMKFPDEMSTVVASIQKLISNKNFQDAQDARSECECNVCLHGFNLSAEPM